MASPTVVPARCRFTVLGPPGLRWGAAEPDPGSPQQQAVLAALPAARGRLVPIGELVDGLWGRPARPGRRRRRAGGLAAVGLGAV
ncbi:hypothetical protein [Amycolatopsis kentuckyensis]|uniref:hypothetical protein n=1 Tax=Amycolatopsis kentuckyensis TaxID=218823 RepID=UPI003563D3BE